MNSVTNRLPNTSKRFNKKLTLEALKRHQVCIELFRERVYDFKDEASNKYKGLCPFHNDDSPSLSMYLDKDGETWLYHCFGCEVSGNIFQFIQHCDEVSLQEATQIVREAAENPEYIAKLKPKRPIQIRPADEQTYSLETFLTNEETLTTSEKGKKWLQSRDIDYETAKRLRFGYKQDIGDLAKGMPELQDKGWIAFPCIYENRVVCIKYRSIVKKQFIREPRMRTALFNTATLAAAKGNVYLVEGECDAAIMEQAGFPAVSLPSGSSLPDLDKLAGFTVILAGDSDEAGLKAMNKAGEQLEGSRLLKWPQGMKDANQTYLEHCKSDPAKFKTLIHKLTAEATVPEPISEERTASPKLVIECAADVKPERIKWLWPNRIPAGKLSTFSGNPDVGKSLVSIDVVSRVTTGQPWPDADNTQPPCDVLMLLAEDDPSDTVVPRLMAAGANLKRVYFVKSVSDKKTKEERMFAFDRDLQALRDMLKMHHEIRLIVVDPLSSYLGKADMNKEQEVRRVLSPLKELAEDTDCAVLAITHFKKGHDAGINKTGGAVALTGVARMAWSFTKSSGDDENLRVMLPQKANITKSRSGLQYRTVEASLLVEGIATGVPVVRWEGESHETLDGNLNASFDPESSKVKKAAVWLTNFLGQKGKPATDVFKAAKKEKISVATLRRAADEIVMPEKIWATRKSDGKKASFWKLPDVEQTAIAKAGEAAEAVF